MTTLRICARCASTEIYEHAMRSFKTGEVISLDASEAWCPVCQDDEVGIEEVELPEALSRRIAHTMREHSEAFEAAPKIALDRARHIMQHALNDLIPIGSPAWDRMSKAAMSRARLKHCGGLEIPQNVIDGLVHFIVADLWAEGVCHLHGIYDNEGGACPQCVSAIYPETQPQGRRDGVRRERGKKEING